MKKTMKRALSCLLAVFLIMMPLSGVASAADYPQGVSAKEAQNAVTSTDKAVKYICNNMMGKPLKQTVMPMLYSDETLSGLLVSLYTGLSENAEDMKNIGVDVSVQNVAEGLKEYKSVYKALIKAEDWQSVDLSKAKWGVKNKVSFANAVAAMLEPLNDVLNMLLCSGSVKVKILSVKGGDGYENTIVPLLNTLDCKNLMSQADFTAAAEEDKNNIVKNLLLPLLDSVENMCDAPVASLTKVLPQFAFFVESGQFDACIDKLMEPITSNTLVVIATFLKILDLSSFEIDLSAMLNEGLAGMAKENGLKFKEIDLASLAACGSEKDGVYKADQGKAYIAILRYLVDTLKENKDALPKMMKDSGVSADMFENETVKSLLSKDTDELISFLISLFTPAKVGDAKAMVYPPFTPTAVSYTANLDQSNFEKVLNGIDGVLDELAKESNYDSVETMLSVQIYTNANINSLLTGIYGAVEKQGMGEAFSLLGIDISPKGVAAYLTESGYKEVRAALNKADSWSKVSLSGVRWNFYDGQRRGFQNAITAMLRPLFPILRLLLAGEDITLFDSVTVKGGDGYNNAVIPILEALGCNENSIKTDAQYKKNANGDGVIKQITDPVFDLVDEALEKPVYVLTGILPNVLYFLNSGSLEVCLSNLLLPVTALTEKLGPVVDFKLDTSSLTKELDLSKLLSSLTADSDIKLPTFDINTLSSIGVLETRTSKSVLNGSAQSYSYVNADKTGVLITVVRLLVDTMKMPENASMLTDLMGNSGGTMAQYSSSIGDTLSNMSTDETVEWLYNLLFKERVTKQIEENTEEYVPTIIYEAPKSYDGLITAGIVVGAILAAGAAVLIINRKRIFGEDGLSVR